MIFQICLPFFFLLVLTSAQVVTLDSVPELKDLRQCALKCYDAHDGALRDPGEGIASELSCKNPNAPDNSCFCRVDLQSSAVKYISTCVDMWCSTNELDASSATQVYKDYCTSAGFTAEPQSVAAQTTSGSFTTIPTSTPRQTAVSPTDTTPASQDEQTPAPKSNSGGLGVGGIVGIAVGAVSAVAAVIGVIIKYKHYQKTKKQGVQVEQVYVGGLKH